MGCALRGVYPFFKYFEEREEGWKVRFVELVCFFPKDSQRTGRGALWGDRRREAAEGELLLRGAALRQRSGEEGSWARGSAPGAPWAACQPSSPRIAPERSPRPEPPLRTGGAGQAVRAAPLFSFRAAGRAGAEPRWRRAGCGCGGGSVRCAVCRERGRRSPVLLLFLLLFLGLFILRAVGKGDVGNAVLRAPGGLGLYGVGLCLCTPSSPGGSSELFPAVLWLSRS